MHAYLLRPNTSKPSSLQSRGNPSQAERAKPGQSCGSESYRNRGSFGGLQALCGAQVRRSVAEWFRRLFACAWTAAPRAVAAVRRPGTVGRDREQRRVPMPRSLLPRLVAAPHSGRRRGQLAARTTQVTGPELVLKTCVNGSMRSRGTRTGPGLGIESCTRSLITCQNLWWLLQLPVQWRVNVRWHRKPCEAGPGDYQP